MNTELRRFTLLDVMIAIAATAAGLAVVRDSVPALLGSFRQTSMILVPWESRGWFCLAMLGSAPLVAFWTLALLVLKLRRPRPTVRRLARQPGFTASCATMLGFVHGVSMEVGLRGTNYGGVWILTASIPIGYAVAASWLTLALNRRWRPVPDLLDRAGRVLGVYWIATVPAFLIARLSIA